MNKKWVVTNTGFALFAMFFGSGNLVFPLVVGQESEGHYLLAGLGIFLTGVVVPFLGVLAMMLYKGNFQQFFNSFGKAGIFWFSLLSLALMGPFGVLARCLTVIHGSMQLIIDDLSLPLVSLVMCSVIYLLAINKNRIVPVLGAWLTPFLLLSIATIALCGFMQGDMPAHESVDSMEAFKTGFFQGYQTMDLLAAFFFSTFVISHLRNAMANEQQSLRVFFKAALLGGSILALVYFTLVYLGSAYAPLLKHVPPQEMLTTIALATLSSTLGPMAAVCVSVAIVLACLTTAITLASLFADFLRKEVASEKINNSVALVVTLAIGFVVSTLEFSGIASFLGPILETVYPALIALTCWNMVYSLRRKTA